MQVAGMKLASTVSVGLRGQQTAARFQYKTNCVKLESARNTNFPTVRQHPLQDISSRGSRPYSTEGITEPDLPISGVSAGEVLTLVNGLIGRGLLDAMRDRKDSIIKVFYNDKNPTSVPKKVIIKYKTMAALESFMKEAFDVPANKSVKLAFKPTGEQEKQRFLEDYVADQLSIAVAVYIGTRE